MRILLPPSEAKKPGGRGRSLAAGRRRNAAAGLADAGLESARDLAVRSLVELCADEERAAAALLLPPTVAAAAIKANRTVDQSPTMPAILRYSGVLYEGLDAGSFSAGQHRAAKQSVLIFSGLFGVLTALDPIPDYRVPAKAVLPELGTAGSYWRKPLAAALPAKLGNGLIIDLRSSDYQAMWQPRRTASLAKTMVRVRILSRKPDGSLGVISYSSKRQKGRLARGLLELAASGKEVAKVEDVATTWMAIGGSDIHYGAGLDLIE